MNIIRCDCVAGNPGVQVFSGTTISLKTSSCACLCEVSVDEVDIRVDRISDHRSAKRKRSVQRDQSAKQIPTRKRAEPSESVSDSKRVDVKAKRRHRANSDLRDHAFVCGYAGSPVDRLWMPRLIWHQDWFWRAEQPSRHLRKLRR